MTDWNSAQYLKYERERTQPSRDLASRLEGEPARILDAGCGPGNSTRVLAQRFPGAEVVGADSSEDMLRRAREDHPDIRFEQADLCAALPFPAHSFDIVFSNACIQWVPDHPALLPRLLALLRPGGQLAVQTPLNQRETFHDILREVAAGEGWRDTPFETRLFHNLTPEGYYDLLRPLCSEVTIWETTYYHVLSRHEEILEWYRGSGLRPYWGALSAEEYTRFEADLLPEVQRRYPHQPDGSILFRFPRLFFLARL